MISGVPFQYEYNTADMMGMPDIHNTAQARMSKEFMNGLVKIHNEDPKAWLQMEKELNAARAAAGQT
jgi:hypothetical protein